MTVFFRKDVSLFHLPDKQPQLHTKGHLGEAMTSSTFKKDDQLTNK